MHPEPCTLHLLRSLGVGEIIDRARETRAMILVCIWHISYIYIYVKYINIYIQVVLLAMRYESAALFASHHGLE